MNVFLPRGLSGNLNHIAKGQNYLGLAETGQRSGIVRALLLALEPETDRINAHGHQPPQAGG